MEFIKHKYTTYFARVKGHSMKNAGINDGDLLIIDKSLEPQNNKIAVCQIDGEFTVKRIKIEKDNLDNIDLVTHRYKNTVIIMMIYLVEFWTGKIKLKEKQQLRWLNRKDIKQFKYLPGSQIIFDRIYENYYKIFK